MLRSQLTSAIRAAVSPLFHSGRAAFLQNGFQNRSNQRNDTVISLVMRRARRKSCVLLADVVGMPGSGRPKYDFELICRDPRARARVNGR